MCLHRNGSQTCVATPYAVSPQALHSVLSVDLAQGDTSSLLSTAILSAALQFQRSIFFSFEIFAGLIFLISLLFFLTKMSIQMSTGSRQERRFIQQKWPEKLLLASIAISLVNAVSVMQTGNALEFTTHKFSKALLVVKAGHILQILEWLAFGFSTVFYVIITKGTTSSSNGYDISVGEKPDAFSTRQSPHSGPPRPSPAFLGGARPPPPPPPPPPP